MESLSLLKSRAFDLVVKLHGIEPRTGRFMGLPKGSEEAKQCQAQLDALLERITSHDDYVVSNH